MHELGLLDEFLKLPHHQLSRFAGYFGDKQVQIADLTHLPVPRALHRHDAAVGLPRFPGAPRPGTIAGFTLLMNAEGAGPDRRGRPVVGVRATVDGRGRGDPRRSRGRRRRPPFDRARGDGPQGARYRRADGRAVVPRSAARPDDSGEVMGRFDAGSMLVMLDRGDYWQCAYRHSQGRGGAGARRAASRRCAPPSAGWCRRSPTVCTSSGRWTISSC